MFHGVAGFCSICNEIESGVGAQNSRIFLTRVLDGAEGLGSRENLGQSGIGA